MELSTWAGIPDIRLNSSNSRLILPCPKDSSAKHICDPEGKNTCVCTSDSPCQISDAKAWLESLKPKTNGQKPSARTTNGTGAQAGLRGEVDRSQNGTARNGKQAAIAITDSIKARPRAAYEAILGTQLVERAGQKEPKALCPLHDDSSPSLRVNLDKGTWYCDPCGEGGGIFELAKRVWSCEFVEAQKKLADLLSLSNGNGHGGRGTAEPSRQPVRDVPSASRNLDRTLRFEVKDLDGNLKATHIRHEFSDGSKSMPWEPQGTSPSTLPLFQIEKTTDSADGESIIVTEGEKKAWKLWETDRMLAVGTTTGASHIPCDESLKPLLRFKVYLWPDNDDPGRRHMQEIAERLVALGHQDILRIEWVDAPLHGDAGNFTGDVGLLVDEAKPFLAGFVIPWESHDLAISANAEYLSRAPVIDKLCYVRAVSMITGGKHAGKSTLARWAAICVAKGLPFLEREVQQGPVFYVASEDETMPARQELLRLGWTTTDPIYFLAAGSVALEQQVEFLKALVRDIQKYRAVLVVLDMLFDFVRIGDEMGYSETRRAVGEIQEVASKANTHITVLHHAPKHASSAADAAVTALGSQGLAARVSPIILVRKHGTDLHSVVSTSVRDPRGASIDERRLLRNEDGSLELGKPWKEWMQAEVFAPKVIELFQEDGVEMSRSDVQEALGISQQLASASLNQLYKDGRLGRSGSGKKGKPFRYFVATSNEPPQISATNGKVVESNGTRGQDHVLSQPELPEVDSGRFGYKD